MRTTGIKKMIRRWVRRPMTPEEADDLLAFVDALVEVASEATTALHGAYALREALERRTKSAEEALTTLIGALKEE